MTLIDTALRGQTVTVDASLLNIGENSGTQTITLDKDNTQVDSQDVSLAAGADSDTTLTWDTSGETLQSYTLKVASDGVP